MSSIPMIIEKKSRESLNEDEIMKLIEAVYNDDIDEAQLGAFLMAVFINGMTTSERIILTREMTKYGEKFQWDETIQGLTVDKHSTGGVGDKVSLILAPAAAACGAKIPMISGRGLGYTGGTLDKLESIPGYRVEMKINDLQDALKEVGVFIAGQTKNLAPVDKKMYAARDRTGTVNSLPLIVGSIMSKKAVEGIKGLVLDVKVGRSALMKRKESAVQLATAMIEVGEALGISTEAILTNMNNPIGTSIGNFLEVIESLQILNGYSTSDIYQLITVEGAKMLQLCGIERNFEVANRLIAQKLQNGSALKKFYEILRLHGVSEEMSKALCTPGRHTIEDYFKIAGRTIPSRHQLLSSESGIITSQNSLALGRLSWLLGAGRRKASDILDYDVGVMLRKKVGDTIQKGDCWAEIYHNRPLPADLNDILDGAITVENISPNEFTAEPMIIDILSKKNCS